ncbi:MAG: DUF4446 family protein [Quinella sp. 3Q1]|nr:DUF4446 family protein [Quinella sp. 3Q1]MBR3050868.1 DUF4446 family protein [Selenomonadaceae bacterium]MBR6888620.1 DUF4446 family protein [Selenomonadaceae bacterium]
MSGLNAAFTTDFLISFALVAIILIMLGLIMNLYSELSTIKTRYKRMMGGSEGSSIEQMLAAHTTEVNDALKRYKGLQGQINTLENLVRSSLARVAVVHFDAFEKTGQGLSWCVAILDRNNNGVIFSSICGQEAERSYVKPIEDGRVSPSYKLTREEEQALRQAMNR